MLETLHVLKPLLATTAALFWWWRRPSGPRQGESWLGSQLALAIIADGVGGYTALTGRHNLWWYDLYVPLEFLLLSAFIWANTSSRIHLYQLAGALVFIVLYTVEMRSVFPLGFVSGAYAWSSFVLALSFMLVLFQAVMDVDTPASRSQRFWLCLGHVCFFAGTLPLLGLWNSLVTADYETSVALYTINHVLFTVRYGAIIFSTFLPAHNTIHSETP